MTSLSFPPLVLPFFVLSSPFFPSPPLPCLSFILSSSPAPSSNLTDMPIVTWLHSEFYLGGATIPIVSGRVQQPGRQSRRHKMMETYLWRVGWRVVLYPFLFKESCLVTKKSSLPTWTAHFGPLKPSPEMEIFALIISTLQKKQCIMEYFFIFPAFPHPFLVCFFMKSPNKDYEEYSEVLKSCFTLNILLLYLRIIQSKPLQTHRDLAYSQDPPRMMIR